MEVRWLKKLEAISGMVFLCCVMTACTSLQSQMASYDGAIRLNMERGKWNAAEHLIRTASFQIEPYEQDDVLAWRKREFMLLKSAFMKNLMSTVVEANSCYSKGAFADGDKIRQSLRDRYFGGQRDSGKDDSETRLEEWLTQDGGSETGVPEILAPCLQLAWVNMLSDRNIARMSVAFSGYLKRIDEIDVNGGKEAIKKFDVIAEGFRKINKWKDKIDLFMEMLADPETARWAPVDRSTYAQSIKSMEAIRSLVAVKYKVKRWNTRVNDRRHDYEKVAQLTATKDYGAAMRILSSHDQIIKPMGVEGVLEFDDQAERSRVASEGLGEAVVRQIFESGLSGVQYHRRTAQRSMISMLIVGRTPIDDKSNKRKLREAGRVAQMQARAEFVRYMNTSVASIAEMRQHESDGLSHEEFNSVNKEDAQAEVSNLVVLATGVDGDEVVIILGWRTPDIGTITPAPMRRVAGERNLTISPSVGAYL